MVLILVGWRSMVDAPSTPGGTGFSSAAAHATLTELLQEQKPHPVGSPQNAVVRDRILAVLRAAGYQPAVRAAFQCTAFGCAQVENIVAVRAGTDPSKAILASAHYDSVPAGPGASDDGSGTAILLELAKDLAKRKPPRSDVIFLLSDSEEYGLNGAHAFARDPDMARVRAVVNLEGRGAAGPSVMFETGAGNAALMELYADVVPYPVANSLAFEIYKRLPNNTDFTVYRDRGIFGFNLAFVGHASLYHTPHDDLAHLDRDTLQHHGDNAFALVRALADANLDELRATGDASYFDLFGRVLIKWPGGLNLPLAGAAFLALVALLVVRRSELRLRAAAWSLLLALLTLPLLFGLGWLLAFPLGRWPGALMLDHPSPWPARAALAAAALLCSVLLGAVAARRGAGHYGGWVMITVLAVVTSALVPGAAYAFLWPAVAFAGLSWALARAPRGAFWASAIGAALAALFWLGHMVMLESAIGFPQSAIKLLAMAPLVWAATPLWARLLAQPGTRGVIPVALCAVLVVGASALAALQTTTSPDFPRGLNVTYQAGDGGPPQWILQNVGQIDPTYLSTHGFLAAGAKQTKVRSLGAIAFAGPVKAAADLGLPAPSFSGAMLQQEDRRVVLTGKVRFSRESFMSGLAIGAASGVLSLRIDGQELWSAGAVGAGKEKRGQDLSKERHVRMGNLPDRELSLELVLDPSAKGPVSLYQRLPLPDSPEIRAMVQGRPPDTLPFGAGDSAVMVKTLWPPDRGTPVAP